MSLAFSRRIVVKAMTSVVTFVAMGSFALPLGGCPDDQVCRDYVPPATFDAQNPPVSFSRQVMPIFGNHCALPSCHGSAFGSANGVYLGGTDAAAIHKRIVEVRSSELPTMSFVKAGDPRESYLLRKMDGSTCLLDAQCTDASCGQSMPRNDETLPIEQRDLVRRWIAQGAKND
jgi:hypothetical protein